MAIARGIWSVIVGIKDLFVLLLLALFFVGIWAALHTRSPLTVPSGAALVLDLDGSVVEQATLGSALDFVRGSDQPGEIEVRDIIGALNSARTDSRIKLVVLDLDTFLGAGEANLQSIGAALRAVKTAGKPVYAYATAYTDDGYYLAAQSTQAWINPLGGVLLTGPGGPNLYFKAALDKLDVDINVFRVGTYKSAVEPFTRSDASPEAEAAEQALVDSLWKTYASDVAAARRGADVNAFLSDLPGKVRASGGDFATTALKAGLVDKIGSRAEFGRAIAAKVGAGKDSRPGAFNGIKLADYRSATKSTGSGDAVGIVYVAGNIVDGEAPRGTAGGDTIAHQIDKAVANNDIKALVVRIDSGGGSVLASERIREALAEAKAKGMPIVASFGPGSCERRLLGRHRGGRDRRPALDDYRLDRRVRGHSDLQPLAEGAGHRHRRGQVNALFRRPRRAARPDTRYQGDPAGLGRGHLPPLHRPRCDGAQAARDPGQRDRPGPGLGGGYRQAAWAGRYARRHRRRDCVGGAAGQAARRCPHGRCRAQPAAAQPVPRQRLRVRRGR